MKRIIFLIALLFITNIASYAQYKSKSNLIIDDKSGNLLYSYQIQNRTMAGHPISVNLNYSSNVLTTSLCSPITTEDNTGWAQLKRSQPAWIVGVNGFAVQVLGQKFCFGSWGKDIVRPFIKPISTTPEGQVESAIVTLPNLNNEHNTVWLVDGYDFCNRMKPLSDNNDQDVIKLLKSDGSILELRNPAQRKNAGDANSAVLYTGFYYEKGIGTQGYAYVTYIPDDELPEYVKKSLANITNPNARRPRKIQYFPGDGLEYVFKEDIFPYGTRVDDLTGLAESSVGYTSDGNLYDEDGNLLPPNLWYWYKDASGSVVKRVENPDFAPTIFYLEAISIAEKKLVDFEWAEEESLEPQTNSEIPEKVYRGRRPVTKFADVTLFPSGEPCKLPFNSQSQESEELFYTIQTLDKTLYLPFTKKFNLVYDNSSEEVREESFWGDYPFSGSADRPMDNDYKLKEGYNSAIKNYQHLFNQIADKIDGQHNNYSVDLENVTNPESEREIPFSAYYRFAEFHFIKGIYENNDRKLEFDYKFDTLYYSSTIYEDKSSGFPFPYNYDNQNGSGGHGLRRVRLKTIDEPTHKYDIIYCKGDDEVDVDSLSNEYDFDSFSTVDSLITYSKLNGKYTKVSETKWNYLEDLTLDDLATELNLSSVLSSGNPFGDENFSRAVIRENKTFTPEQTTFSAAAYKEFEINSPLNSPGISSEGNSYKTQVPVVNLSINGSIVNQTFTQFAILNNSFVLPTKTLKRLDVIGDETSQNQEIGFMRFEYEFEDLIDFVGVDANSDGVVDAVEFATQPINTFHGRRISSQTSKVIDPTDKTTEIYSTKSYFLNLRHDHEFEYAVSNELRDRKSSISGTLKNGMQNVLAPLALVQDPALPVMKTRLAPAIFGLLEKKFVKAGGKVLSGVWHKYAGDVHGYGEDLPFGSLISTYRLPEADSEQDAINQYELVASYDYWRGAPINGFDFSYGNLKSVTNANGVKTKLYYDKRYQEAQGSAKVMFNDESKSVQSNWYSTMDYQMPIATYTDVRSSHGTTTLSSKAMYDKFGNVQGSIDPNGFLTWNEYDDLGRVIKITKPYDFDKGFKMIDVISETCVPLFEEETKVEVEKDEWLLYEEEVARRMQNPETVSIDDDLVTANVLPRFNFLDSSPKQSGAMLNLKSKISLTYIPWDNDQLHKATSIESADLKLNCLISGNPFANILKLEIPDLRFSKTVLINNQNWIKPVGNCGSNVVSFDKATPIEVRFDLTEVIDDIKNLKAPVEMLVSTPSLDASVKVLNDAEDSKPCLNLSARLASNDDFTYAFEYNDQSFETKVISKLDDAGHFSHYNGDSFNKNLLGYSLGDGLPTQVFAGRYIAMMNKNISPTESQTVIMERPSLFSGVTLNTNLTDGLGRVINSTNIYGQTTSYDYTYSNTPDPISKRLGSTIILPENENGAVTQVQSTVRYCAPTQVTQEGFSNPDISKFYGLAIIKETEMEGISSKKFYNALGQLLYSIDNGKATKYYYDEHARLMKIEKPGSTFSKVWYDNKGNVTNKFSKEKGVFSVVANDLGQVRFSQNEKQAQEHKLSFNQYDDLGRKTLVGEAEFDASILPYVAISSSDVATDNVFGKRKIDTMDANYLRYNGSDNYAPTVNNTIYNSNSGWLNLDRHLSLDFPFISNFSTSSVYQDTPNGNGDIDVQIFEFLNGSYITAYPPSATGTSATFDNFEDVSQFPNFVLQVVAYDQLPQHSGAIWGGMPEYDVFDKLLEGIEPNLKGNVSAIAYRDSKEDEFNYVVIHYDARSRVKAFVRYTPDNGFDAVHYSYNSADKVTAIHAFDANSTYATWYGYNDMGQLVKVWSKMYKTGDPDVDPYFVGLKASYMEPWEQGNLKPIFEMINGIEFDLVEDLDIAYEYNNKFALESKSYAYYNQNLTVNYGYNTQGILSSIAAFDPNGHQLFKDDVLERDNFNRIKQLGSEYSQSLLVGFQNSTDVFDYDNQGQLTEWAMHKSGQIVNYQNYDYDAIGNITSITDDQIAHDTYTYNYTTSGNNNIYGANRLNRFNHYTGYDDFVYDVLGNTTQRLKYDDAGQLIGKEEFEYNTSGLLRTFIKDVDGNNNNWTFTKKYSIFGGVQSNEMKTAAESVSLTYDYNLVGAGGETIVRYHGLVDDSSPGNEIAFIYPYEMLVNGGEVTKRFDGTRSIAVSGMRGNVRLAAEVDETGTATFTSYEYTPFGKQIGSYALSSQDIGFGGSRKEMKSDYHQLGARTYDPDMGRFLQQDQLFEIFPGHSSYSFGFNNPVMFGDPSGLAPEKHQKGGGDVLLGSGSLAAYFSDCMNTVTPSFTYLERIGYVETYVEFTGKENYHWPLNRRVDKARLVYETRIRTEGGGGISPSYGYGPGGGESSANDNSGYANTKFTDESKFNLELAEFEASMIRLNQEAYSFQSSFETPKQYSEHITPLFFLNFNINFEQYDESGLLSSMEVLSSLKVWEYWAINSSAFNCHYYAWYGYDHIDNGFAYYFPYWDNSPLNEIMEDCVEPLAWDAPLKVGDIVIYSNTARGLFLLDNAVGITHSGVVAEVSADGKATKIRSKWGEFPVYEHTPRNWLAVQLYGDYRRYFRIKQE